jgi:hypothetical protein
LNFLGVFVGNFDAEFLFETHHQLNRVQRVSTQVIDEPRVWRHFVFVNTKLVNDYLFYFLLNLLIGHSFAPLLNVRQTRVCRLVS